MLYKGGCHCGGVPFEVEADLGQVIQCNCSHCAKKGYLLTFVPRDRLRLETPEEALATYTFNTHRIRHHFCPTCGCAPFGDGTSPKGEPTAAVNVRCLNGVDLASLTIVPFDGRSL
ncbi:MAG TPA: GFA family protein [Beijerinckiaceae bacterium]|jgi:hypothetical protein